MATTQMRIAAMAQSINKGVPMISVPDISVTLDWYRGIGFREINRFAEDGVVNFGMVALGNAELMFRIGECRPEGEVRLWFYTDQVDAIYELFKSGHLKDAAACDGRFEFVEEIYNPFYGGRQFSIRDLNGYHLVFLQI